MVTAIVPSMLSRRQEGFDDLLLIGDRDFSMGARRMSFMLRACMLAVWELPCDPSQPDARACGTDRALGATGEDCPRPRPSRRS